MALERSDVEKIAHLARLGLNDADIPRTTEALNSILGLVDQMQAVDTTGIEPLAHPLEATQRLREDAVTERNRRDTYRYRTSGPRRTLSGSESHRVRESACMHQMTLAEIARGLAEKVFFRRADPRSAVAYRAA